MPPLLMKLIFVQIKKTKMPFFAKPIANAIADKVLQGFVDPNLARQMAFMEDEMRKGPWFLGPDFSAADIQMSFPIEAANQRAGLAPATTPRLLDWLQRAHARPAYQRALEKGGPYDFA
jgi:glutathione S-transferase